jgi:hypothetical protein
MNSITADGAKRVSDFRNKNPYLHLAFSAINDAAERGKYETRVVVRDEFCERVVHSLDDRGFVVVSESLGDGTSELAIRWVRDE